MGKLLKTTVIFILLFSTIGCTSKNIKSIERASDTDVEQIIHINSNLYYVSLGRDKDGCMMYQARSDTMATAQAIIYQNGIGIFSMGKDKKTCQ